MEMVMSSAEAAPIPPCVMLMDSASTSAAPPWLMDTVLAVIRCAPAPSGPPASWASLGAGAGAGAADRGGGAGSKSDGTADSAGCGLPKPSACDTFDDLLTRGLAPVAGRLTVPLSASSLMSILLPVPDAARSRAAVDKRPPPAYSERPR